MSKIEPDEDPEHIEVLDPTWIEGEGDVRPEPPSRFVLDERMLGRLAWFSVAATMTTVLVALVVVGVSVVALLSEPEPIVFDRRPVAPPVVVQRLDAPTDGGVPPVTVDEAEGRGGAPPVLEPPLPQPPPAPAPELPTDLPTQALVPGELPEGSFAEAPSKDTAEEAPEALQSDRVTVRLGSEPPGADVRVNRRFRGRTPVKLTLNPGKHDIELELGGATTSWTLDATADERRCFVVDGRELVPTDCS